MTTTSPQDATRTKTPGRTKRPAGRRKTKRELLIDMLSRRSGADAKAISTKLGWQPHTTRAALSGLRKAGYEITSVKRGNGKPVQYKIAAGPAE